MKRIFTLGDARDEKALHWAQVEARIQRKELRAKVRKWERKAKRYGGEIQLQTLARFKAELAKVE